MLLIEYWDLGSGGVDIGPLFWRGNKLKSEQGEEKGEGQLVLRGEKWQQKTDSKVINRSFSRREGGLYCA